MGRPHSDVLEFHDNYEKLSELIIGNLKMVINKYTEVPYFAISIVGTTKKEVIMTLGGDANLYRNVHKRPLDKNISNIAVLASNINITYADLKQLIEEKYSELNIKCISTLDDDSALLCMILDRITEEIFSNANNAYYVAVLRRPYKEDPASPICFNFKIPNSARYYIRYEISITKLINILPPNIFEPIKYKIAKIYTNVLNNAESQCITARRAYETMKDHYDSLLKEVDELLDEDQKLFIEVNRHSLM